MIFIPHLETNVTVACQLRCVSCNHFVALQAFTAKQSIADPRQVEKDLAHLAPIVHAEAYGMLGGEPLLHPDLTAVLNVARASGIADVIEVWTNGIAIRKQSPQFWRAFDRLVVSVYPGTLGDDDLRWIAEKCNDEMVQCAVKDERHVPNFEQLLEREPTEGATTQAKYDACFFKSYSRVVDNGFFYRCCTSPFIPKLLMQLPSGTDGIAVEGLTESALAAFLAQSQPALSCTHCVGLNPANRRRTPWREVRDAHEWIEASSEALVIE